LIKECLSLKSRQNSISSEQPLVQQLPPIRRHENGSNNNNDDDDSTSTTSTISARVEPVKLKKKTKKKLVQHDSMKFDVREETKAVSFSPIKKRELPTETKPKDDDDNDEEIEELLPVEIQPHGTVGRTLYWNRI